MSFYHFLRRNVYYSIKNHEIMLQVSTILHNYWQFLCGRWLQSNKIIQTHNNLLIKMRNSPSLALMLALMLLIHEPVAALNWQGTGEVSSEKLTFIWKYINEKILDVKDSFMQGGLEVFNNGLSETLNTAFAPAWNTVSVLVYAPTYNDVLVYGYAFNNQWLWFNGFIVSGISGTFSFVIWKEYNCQTWKSLGDGIAVENQATGFSDLQLLLISQWITNLQAAQILDDPWGAARSLVEEMQSSSQFVVANNRAYSIIMQQQSYIQAEIRARLCVVGQQFYDSYWNNAQKDLVSNGKDSFNRPITFGRFIVFRTR